MVVIGAGAAGMMCAIEAGKRGRKVLVIDHARAPGEKIRISGGGRCNFTNLAGTTPGAYISANKRFAISALTRYPPKAFIALVEKHGIAWHEKTLGQLFCDESARQIIAMLTAGMKAGGVMLKLGQPVKEVRKVGGGYELAYDGQTVACESLVIATGGLSIPKMGATGFGYQVATKFGLRLVETRPGLVPLTLDAALLAEIKPLAGVSLPVRVIRGRMEFDEGMLFTHRGLSGPAILQASSYWSPGDLITVDMFPGKDFFEQLRLDRQRHGRQAVHTVLSHYLPQHFAQLLTAQCGTAGQIDDASDKILRHVADQVNA